MQSNERPRIAIFGAIDEADVAIGMQIERNFMHDRKAALVSEYTPDKLFTGEQMGVLTELNALSLEYYDKKLQQYGKESDFLHEVDVIYYDQPPENFKVSDVTHGFFSPELNLIAVKVASENDPRTVFTTAMFLHHERGHAIAPSDLFIRVFDDVNTPHQYTARTGLTTIGNGTIKASIIEEGLVLLDQRDFYVQVAGQYQTPALTDEELSHIDTTHALLNASEFGPFSIETVRAFSDGNVTQLNLLIALRIAEILASSIGMLAAEELPVAIPEDHVAKMGRYMLDSGRVGNYKAVLSDLAGNLGPAARHIFLLTSESPTSDLLQGVLIAKDLEELCRNNK